MALGLIFIAAGIVDWVVIRRGLLDERPKSRAYFTACAWLCILGGCALVVGSMNWSLTIGTK